jgi:phosphohistidine phosphatase
MKSVLVLHHAKSSWKHPDLTDHERPLNKRGKRDAPSMGRLLKKENLIPDIIISSTAIRARATAEPLAIKETLLLMGLFMLLDLRPT